jgi:hypothetical protein
MPISGHRSQAAILATIIAGSLTLLGAANANAAIFCVNTSSCLGGTTQPTVQAALDEAALNSAGEDTVRIGPGDYTGPFSYTDSETVHVVGAGPGETNITNDGSGSSTFSLISPTSSIKGMTVEIPDVSNGAGLNWDASASEIQAVHDGAAGTSILGMRALGSASLDDSTVNANGSAAFSLVTPTNVSITDSSIRGGSVGVRASGTGFTLNVTGSSVTASQTAVEAAGTSTLNVTNSVLRRTATTPSLNDALTVLSGVSAVVRHATIVGNGTGRGALVSADSADSSLLIFDSILRGFPTAIQCGASGGHTATFAIQYSSFTDPTSLAQCSGTGVGTGNDTTTVPEFVGDDSLLANFRLDAPSPLIDAGDPGDPVLVDLAGGLRPVDGDGVGGARSDMGAYEYQHQTPAASINAPATATVGVPASFSAAGSSDPDPGDGVTSSWDFGDGGLASGFAPTHTFASPGVRTVTLTVTDPTGLSATATAQVQVQPGALANTEITAGPTNKQLRKRKARFAFTASEPGVTFECRLDDAPFATCTSPVTLKRLKRGRHEFAVRALNASGPDATPATKRFKVKRRR